MIAWVLGFYGRAHRLITRQSGVQISPYPPPNLIEFEILHWEIFFLALSLDE